MNHRLYFPAYTHDRFFVVVACEETTRPISIRNVFYKEVVWC